MRPNIGLQCRVQNGTVNARHAQIRTSGTCNLSPSARTAHICPALPMTGVRSRTLHAVKATRSRDHLSFLGYCASLFTLRRPRDTPTKGVTATQKAHVFGIQRYNGQVSATQISKQSRTGELECWFSNQSKRLKRSCFISLSGL